MKNKNPLWDRNDIQFPRLLSEICACQDNLLLSTLADSMDLDIKDVVEILDRAQQEWETIKKEFCLAKLHHDRNKKSQVYIHLFHGRKNITEQMEDWGESGPIFGPFDYIHTTYGSDIKLGELGVLSVVDDVVFYNGMLYGDWSVCTLDMFDTPTIAVFNQNLANISSSI